MKKKITAVGLICALLFSQAAFAEAYRKNPIAKNSDNMSKYSFYTDFSGDITGEKPSKLSGFSEAANTSVFVTRENNEEGVRKKMLCVEDASNSANVGFNIPISQKSAKTLVEIKFKYVATGDEFCNFEFELKNSAGSTAAELIQFSGGESFCLYNGETVELIPQKLISDQWYTLEVMLNSANNSLDAQTHSEALKNLPENAFWSAPQYEGKLGAVLVRNSHYMENYTGGPIESFDFHTNTGTRRGKFYFDYISVTENVSELVKIAQKVSKLPLPKIATPLAGPIAGSDVNVKYKDEYMFFTYKPFTENDVIYVPLKSIAAQYGYSIKTGADASVLTKDDSEVTVTKDSDSVKVNSSAAAMGSSAIVRNGVYYVPIIGFVKAIGGSAEVGEGNIIVIE